MPTERRVDRNAGFLSTSDVPDDVYIAGYVLVTLDESGEYGFIFRPESLDEVPSQEVQETLGRWLAQAFQLANERVIE